MLPVKFDQCYFIERIHVQKHLTEGGIIDVTCRAVITTTKNTEYNLFNYTYIR